MCILPGSQNAAAPLQVCSSSSSSECVLATPAVDGTAAAAVDTCQAGQQIWVFQGY
jgi:hypothetical protein